MKIHLLSTFFFLFFPLLTSVQADTLTMGFFALKPHMYKSDGVARGAALLHFEKIAHAMGHSIKWLGPLPFPRLVKYLKEGTIDGAQMFTKNKTRTTYLYYPARSYSPVYSLFAVRKDQKIHEIVSIDDVKGFRVGFLKGGNLSAFMRENIDDFQMTYIPNKDWVKQNLKKVVLGRLDAAYDINHFTMKYEAAKLGISDQLNFLLLPEKPMHVYTVFAKNSLNGKKYIEQYNNVASQLISSYDTYVQLELAKVVK